MENQTLQTPAETQTTEKQGKAPGKAPGKGDVKAAIREQMLRDEKTIQDLKLRIEVLEKNQKEASVKLPVSDSDLQKAVTVLQAKNKASLSSESPRLDLSLAAQLGFVPDLTAEQRKVWGKERDAMRHDFSLAWKERSAKAMGYLRRAVKNPAALMGGAIKTRKTDNAVTAVSLRASKLAKPLKRKGGGKNGAKPANVAAKVPTVEAASKPLSV